MVPKHVIDNNGLLGGTEKQKSLMDWVWSETQELRAHCEKSRNMISEIESQYSELLKRSETVQREIQDAEERLEQAKENLDECMEKLRRAERRHDCAESKTLASMAGTGLIGPQSTKRDMSPAINRSSEAPSRDVSSTEVIYVQSIFGFILADAKYLYK